MNNITKHIFRMQFTTDWLTIILLKPKMKEMSTVAKSFSDFRLISAVAVTEVLSVSVYT